MCLMFSGFTCSLLPAPHHRGLRWWPRLHGEMQSNTEPLKQMEWHLFYLPFCSTWENNHRPLATRQSRFMSSQYFVFMCLDTVTRSEEHNKSLQSPNGSQNLLVFTRDSPVRHVGFFIKDHLSHTHWWKETQPCRFTSLWGLWLNSFGYGITAIFCYASYIENN